MAEKLKLVRRFEELQPGMIVVVKGCDICGGNHRDMLLSPEMSATRDPLGEIAVELCFPVVPGAHGLDACVVNGQVSMGVVWRVEDGFEQSESEDLWRRLKNGEHAVESRMLERAR